MVIAKIMNKSTLKVSVSDNNSSSEEESEDNESNQRIDDASAEESEGTDLGHDSDVAIMNEGWADSVAKILSTSKPKNKKTLVLSRAKKFSETIKKEKEEKPSFEVIGEKLENEVKTESKSENRLTEPEAKKKKLEKPSQRLKPNILEKDRERLLSKIATKGVVQLFNAVRNQQKSIEKEIDRKDLSEAKRERILKKFDKRAFLDTLMGPTKSIIVDDKTKSFKNEVKEENTPKWSALRDDFMIGAKMKDWDKESIDD